MSPAAIRRVAGVSGIDAPVRLPGGVEIVMPGTVGHRDEIGALRDETGMRELSGSTGGVFGLVFAGALLFVRGCCQTA